MPYIKDENNRRGELQKYGAIALTAGELNFKIFVYVKGCIKENLSPDPIMIKDFVNDFLLTGKLNYQKYNDMTGCLVRCRKEIQRRLKFSANLLIEIMESYDYEIADYEDEKIIENGDV